MNSLNILSAISTTPPRPSHVASASGDTLLGRRSSLPSNPIEGTTEARTAHSNEDIKAEEEKDAGIEGGSEEQEDHMFSDEQTPLLGGLQPDQFGEIKKSSSWRALPSRISSAIYGTVKVVVSWVTAPGRYLVAFFFDEDGTFSPFLPLITVARAIKPKRRKRSAQMVTDPEISEKDAAAQPLKDKKGPTSKSQRKAKRTPSVATSSNVSATATDSEFDAERLGKTDQDRSARHTRSMSSLSSTGEEIAPSRRSIRIKLHNEDALKRRRKQQDDMRASSTKEADAKEMVAASLKSPSGGSAIKMTKFPKTPLPPRPLVPRRQPSYSKMMPNGVPQKTLIIDLDETLIHSHSKGGRFATGHMVEVKMSHAVGVNGVTIGPQVPILYYVHKRPHCDEFLRKVSSLMPTKGYCPAC
jgi:CTD nuclear envelope phosphatase 1